MKGKLKPQIVISLVLVAAIFMLVYSVFSYFIINNILLSSQEDLLRAAARIAAGEADPDILVSLEAGDDETEEYLRELEKLREVKEITNLAYIYSLRELDDENMQFIVDSDDSDGHQDIGNPYEIYEAIQVALDTKDVAVDEEIIFEEGEYLYSAFAPIVNSEGEMVGLMGADLIVDDMMAARNGYLLLFIGIGIVGMGLAVFIGFKNADSIKKRINEATRGINRNADNLNDLKVSLTNDYGSVVGFNNESQESLRAVKDMMDGTRNALSKGDEAHRVIGESVEQIKEIVSNVIVKAEEMGEAIDNITKTTNEMGKLTGLIGGIASQTNMLAINASVEAARAGEAGKGFAVVAEEVKSLSQNTSETLDSIDKIIEENLKNADVCAKKANELENVINKATSQVTDLENSINVLKEAAEEENKNIQSVFNQVEDVEKNNDNVTHGLEDNMNMIKKLDNCSKELIDAISVSNDYLGK